MRPTLSAMESIASQTGDVFVLTGADAEAFRLTIELFETYLEKAA